jgi:P27 family predicted phage terminase small subunit
MPGPRPTPTALKRLRGNPGKRPLNFHEASPPSGFPPPPRELAVPVKKAYRKLGRQLLAAGLVSKLDGHLLALFAQTWCRWLEAEQQLARSGPVIRSPNNYPIMSPFLFVSNQCQKQLRSLAAEFGLSPAARSRVHVIERSSSSFDAFEAYLNGEPTRRTATSSSRGCNREACVPMSYRQPTLRRTCESCQRCPRHCFGDPDCRMGLHREVCLTCSNAVSMVEGLDASRARAVEKTLENQGV